MRAKPCYQEACATRALQGVDATAAVNSSATLVKDDAKQAPSCQRHWINKAEEIRQMREYA